MYTNNYVDESPAGAKNKACEFPVNLTYTFEQDINPDVHSRITYNSPSNWSASRSENKCIGLREAKFIPYECDTVIPFSYRLDGAWHDIQINLSAHRDYSLAKIIADICDAVNETLEEHGLVFDYDYDGTTLKLSIDDTDHTGDARFNFGLEANENLKHLCRLLNQNIDEAMPVLTWSASSMTFRNVWDRKNIYIHSSISSDFNQLLCENYSKYSPKKYLFASTAPTFDIWFSTDMKNIIPIHSCGTFILKLAFIYNYRKAAI